MSEPEQRPTELDKLLDKAREPIDELPRSRALGFDPADPEYRRKKDLTAPLKLPTTETASRSPLIFVIAAGVLLAVIASIVFVLASGEDRLDDENGRSVADLTCNASSSQDVNIRMGPGFDYPRAWILPSGESRLVLAQVNSEWLQLENGWLHADDVDLSSSVACNKLPESESPELFSDDIPLPDSIAELEWGELLGDSFAVDVNGWVKSADPTLVAIREGELLLFSSTLDSVSLVSPIDSPAPDTLSDAYFAFRMEWVASDLAAEALLRFRVDGEDGYEVAIRRDGVVSVRTVAGTILTSQQNAVPIERAFDVGVLNHGEAISIYVDGNLLLEVTDKQFESGAYYLGLSGRDSSLRITRFEIRIPNN